MRPPLTPKTFLLFTSSSSLSLSSAPLLRISHLSTSSHYPSHFAQTSRRHDEESRNVRVSVWWDFENCNLPAGTNVFKVAHSITAAVRANGIKGPVTITAFGDVLQLSRGKQEALSATGVNLCHVPQGGKNCADRSLLVDLMHWVSQNPPPVHLFLISSDRDFASVLHRLRMNNYNILLASTECAPSVLCSAASIMWHWHALIRGENLTGKHFNQPPDGPYGSWYGHYKVPLQDPFSVAEQPACSQPEDLPEPGSDSKPRPVPKTLMRLIRQILNTYPKGISIRELRSELGKSNVSIEKHLYGYKKFSHFLLSMPHILKLQPDGDGQFVVRRVTPKTPEPFESNPVVSTEPDVNMGVQDHSATSKTNGEVRSSSGAVNGNSLLPPSSGSSVKEPEKKMQQHSPLGRSVTGSLDEKSLLCSSPEKNVEDLQMLSPSKDKVFKQGNEGHLALEREQDSASEVGFFKRVWRKCFANGVVDRKNEHQSVSEKSSTSDFGSQEKICSTAENNSDSIIGLKRAKVKDECAKSTSQNADPRRQVPHPSVSSDSVTEGKTATDSEASGDKSRTKPGFFTRIVEWCKFWRNDPKSEILSDQAREEGDQKNSQSGKHELFSKDTFWSEMESFMDTPTASVIISQSRTREQMAENLQKDGPTALRCISASDLLHLVDLLIREIKWVEECPSQTSPFKLARTVGKRSMGQSHGSNGLSSIFLDTISQSLEHSGEKKNKNIPHSGVSPPAMSKNSSVKSRSDITADCHLFVNELSKVYPDPTSQSLEHSGEKIYKNIPHTVVSPPFMSKNSSVRSRSDMMADCQKLVSEILKDFPEGYNMGLFRKLFREKYGYALDLQKLGHSKLASLLQEMPGVKIESTYIFPSDKTSNSSCIGVSVPGSQEKNVSHSVANSDSEPSDTAKKDDDIESSWEELGPVAKTGSSRTEMEFVSSRKAIYPDYEPSVSDDDFSESEGETSTLTGPEGHVKKVDEEDSSLLRILDSWYSSKEDDNGKKKSENIDGMIDCSTNGPPKSSGSSAVGTSSDTHMGNYGRKQRSQKTYRFVSDPVEAKRDRLIDGILGSLKKSDEPGVQG